MPCYTGPDGTRGVGRCAAGTALCSASATLGSCSKEVTPSLELCDGLDNDCDGLVDEDVTNACGGCSELPNVPGDACGVCGVWACNGGELLRCESGRLNNCGTCGAPDVAGLSQPCTSASGCVGVMVCDESGTTSVCGAPERNTCGLCEPEDGCDPDMDGDGVPNASDTCPTVAGNQTDADGDGKGDLCDLVISELAAAGPNGAGDEFIELYNGSNQPVPLAGWMLQTVTAAGAARLHAFDDSAVIPARGFYLVTSMPADGGYAGPVADEVALNLQGLPKALGLGPTGGAVRLGLPGVTTSVSDPWVSDVVGYGTAAVYRGVPAPAPAWHLGESLERKAAAGSTSSSMLGAEATAGNNYDSHHNETDFVLRATRQPQHSASAAEPP